MTDERNAELEQQFDNYEFQNAKDFDAAIKVINAFTKATTIQNKILSESLENTKEIRKYFTNVFANVELNSKIINPYHEIRGNMVVTWGDYITTIKNKKDNSITTAKGRFTDVAVKENGKWKIIVDHTSPQPEDPKPAN